MCENVARAAKSFGKKIPRQEQGILGMMLQRKSRMRMMSGIGIPTSQSRMGMVFLLQSC
jgi:hypothetical protein